MKLHTGFALCAFVCGASTPAALAVAADGPKPAAKASALPPLDATYEVRGFFGAGVLAKVSLGIKGESASQWYAAGRKTGDLAVEKIDAAAGYAILNRGGVRTTARIAFAKTSTDADRDDELDAEIRAQERRTVLEKLFESYSDAQKQAIERIMMEKLTPLILASQDPSQKPDTKKMMAAMEEALIGASTEAAKLPDRNGRIVGLPEDFSAMVHEEFDAQLAKAGEAEAAAR